MADTLAELLMQPNALAGEARPSRTYGAMGEPYDVQYVEPPPIGPLLGRFGFRGMPQARVPAGPWTPKDAPAPRAPLREAKQAGDDGIGQHIYEALLGRTRQPGDAVGRNYNPLWKNPAAYVIGGLGGYLGYKAGDNMLGVSDAYDRWQKGRTPGTPEYDARQSENAGPSAKMDAARAERDLALALKLMESRWYQPPTYVSPDAKRELENYRLPGGVGDAPY